MRLPARAVRGTRYGVPMAEFSDKELAEIEAGCEGVLPRTVLGLVAELRRRRERIRLQSTALTKARERLLALGHQHCDVSKGWLCTCGLEEAVAFIDAIEVHFG